MKQPNTAERREGEGLLRAGQEEPAAEDADPPRPNSAPSSPYLGLVYFLFCLFSLISELFVRLSTEAPSLMLCLRTRQNTQEFISETMLRGLYKKQATMFTVP